MTRVLTWLAGLLVVVAATAAFAPAALVAALVADATRGQLRLANARGTVWNGEGEVVPAGDRWTLPVAWRLQPGALLRGEVRIALRSPDGSARVTGEVRARRGEIAARDVSLGVPAAALRLPAGVSAGGELRATSSAVTLRSGSHEGSLLVEWSRARIARPGAGTVDLGTVQASLAADGARWRGPVRSRGGSLIVDGEASVDAAGADIALVLVPQPGASDAMRTLLGPADADGAVRWRATPRFR